MAYDAGSIFARIYARFDEGGFDRFDRRVSKARADTARPIDAKLGADYQPGRLNAFERDLSGARRAAARPITAHARVEYDPGPLRRFVLALGGAGGGINRFRRTLGDADDGMGAFNRRMLMLRNAMRLMAFPAAIASLGALGGALNGLIATATAAVATLSQLAGAAVLMPAALGAAVQGLGTFLLGTAGVGDALKAMSDQQAKAGTAAQDNARQQEAAADRILSAREALADANRAERKAQTELGEAWRQSRRDLQDMRLAAQDARLFVEQAAAAYEEAVRAVGRAVASDATYRYRRASEEAGRSITRAMLDMRDAAIEADRAMEDMRSSAMRALFGVRDAQNALTKAQQEYNLAVGRGESPERQSQYLGEVERAEWELTQTQRQRARAIEDINRAMNARMTDSAERRAQRDMLNAQRDQAQALRDVVRAQREQRAEVRAAQLEERRAEQELRSAKIERRRSQEDLNRALAASRPVQVAEAEERLADAQRSTARAARDLARAQRDATQAQGAAATAANKVAEEMGKLPPAAQRFARFLFSLKPRLDDVRNTAAKGLLPGVETGIRRALRNFPALDRVVGATARTMGRLAEQAGAFVGSRAFGRDFERIAATNNRLIGNMGRGSINLASAMRHVLVAAGPFIRWFGDATERFTSFIDRQARAGRESGRLAAFFDRLKVTMQLLGSTLGNLGLALVRIGGIANRELGQHMLRGLDRASASLERWTRSTRGQNQIARYFRDARPVADEFGRLIRDITVGLLKLGSGRQTAGLIRSLRTELLPVLLELFTVANRHLMPALIDGFVAVAKILRDLAPALGATLRALSGMVRAVAWLIENIPGIKGFVGALIAMRGLYLALRIAATISGLTTIVKLLRQVGVLSAAGGGAGVAGGAASATAGGAAAGAAGGGLTGLASRIGPARLIGGGVAIAGVQVISAADVGKIKDVRSGLESWGRAAFQSLKIINPGVRAAAFAAEKFGLKLGEGRHELGKVTNAIGQTGKSIRLAFQLPAVNIARPLAEGFERAGRVTRRGLANVRYELGKLPPAARKHAADAMVGMVAQLEAKGRLPKGSARKLRDDISASFNGLKLRSIRSAREMMDGVDRALRVGPIIRRTSTTISRGMDDVAAAFDRATAAARRFSAELGARRAGSRLSAGVGSVPTVLPRQKGGTKRLTLEDLEEMKRQKGNRGGKAGPGAGKPGPQIVVYGEGNKQEWWISQEGDKRQNVAWAVEALEKLTGKRVTLARAGARPKAKVRTVPMTDPLTGRTVQVRKGEKVYLPAGRFGGRTLTGRIHSFLASMEPLRATISTKTRLFEQAGREYGQSEEILLAEDPATGDLVVRADQVEKQAKEYDDLKAKAEEIRNLYHRLQTMYAQAIGQLRGAIKFFRDQVNDQKAKIAKAHPRDRGWRRGLLRQFQGNLNAMTALEPGVAQGHTDAGLDAQDWQLTSNEMASLAADVRATAGSTAPRVGLSDTGPSGPSPEDVARAAFDQYQSFQGARASLARDFGANFMRTGGTMPGGAANEHYPRFFGAFGAEQGSGGGQQRTEITVNNNYASGPGDPHTWSQDQKWQLSTMGVG